jgi:hypothetical protein
VRKKPRYRTFSGTGRAVNGNYHAVIVPPIEKNIKSTTLKNNDLELDLGEFYAKRKPFSQRLARRFARKSPLSHRAPPHGVFWESLLNRALQHD